MRSSGGDDLGKLLLRIGLGVLILFHGASKIVGGPGFVTDVVAKAHWPHWIAYLVYIGEVIAPLLVLLGIWTRPAALVIAINMAVAVWLVHQSQFFTLASTGGWALELQGMYFVVALVLALIGAGRFSVGGAGGRWN
jgi:putative oxidoreductase